MQLRVRLQVQESCPWLQILFPHFLRHTKICYGQGILATMNKTEKHSSSHSYRSSYYLSMRHQTIILSLLFLTRTMSLADTNFVQRLNETWAQHDAQALLEFVETSAATNPCLETITAQGLVYGFILGWGAASTNLFEQAKTRALTVDSSRYTEAEKAGIVRCVSFLQSCFVSRIPSASGSFLVFWVPPQSLLLIPRVLPDLWLVDCPCGSASQPLLSDSFPC